MIGRILLCQKIVVVFTGIKFRLIEFYTIFIYFRDRESYSGDNPVNWYWLRRPFVFIRSTERIMYHTRRHACIIKQCILQILVVTTLVIVQPMQGFGQVFRGYYSNGTVHFKSKKDKKRQIIRGYYPSGALEFIATYKKGELEGVVREYYENGILKAEIPYKENRRHGLAKFYYENGMLMGKIEFKRGRETGEAKFYDENGILTRSTPRMKRRLRRTKRYETANHLANDSVKTRKER